MNIRILVTWMCFALAFPVFGADALTYRKLSTYPNGSDMAKEGATGEAANGLAFGEGYWFYATEKRIYRLNSDFQNAEMEEYPYPIAPKSSFHYRPPILPKSVSLSTIINSTKCDHIGGIDFYNGELYAAIEKCDDEIARVVVLNLNLEPLRTGLLPFLNSSIPWVAVNPQDDQFLYTVNRKDKQTMVGFPRVFCDGAELATTKQIVFQDNPDSFWQQGGAFSRDGLFYRVVDVVKKDKADYSGIWLYQIDTPIVDGSKARRIGFISIKYIPWWKKGLTDIGKDIYEGVTGDEVSKEGYRDWELEDIDVTPITEGPMKGDVHVMMLDNDLQTDNLSIYHYVIDRSGSSVDDNVFIHSVLPALFPMLL